MGPVPFVRMGVIFLFRFFLWNLRAEPLAFVTLLVIAAPMACRRLAYREVSPS
jgi:hypothetical protein